MLYLRVPGMPGGREGEVIMTSKRVFGTLAVIALVALSATGAQAGNGGTPSALTSFFVCNSISGDDAARRVQALGGRVLVQPFAVTGVARIALVQDGVGAQLGLWQSDG